MNPGCDDNDARTPAELARAVARDSDATAVILLAVAAVLVDAGVVDAGSWPLRTAVAALLTVVIPRGHGPHLWPPGVAGPGEETARLDWIVTFKQCLLQLAIAVLIVSALWGKAW